MREKEFLLIPRIISIIYMVIVMIMSYLDFINNEMTWILLIPALIFSIYVCNRVRGIEKVKRDVL
ncbi:hypothetical protein [Clostridium sp. LIBA-8841]|uniref:hypothetical protein n=1 Tax=Clostridium sp. LIBA-8841 TaxID=2987530 RepID=UPI002AC712A6|nr:hypothetical protein [Clostridium sp. LIBA-8841]MDZ5255137.1 hypothetical protein [Clostridium sp. LIBA-8841]